ncbi:class III chitinase ChiA2 [Talaromyces proteolyticus]|uniref:Class III chitinase ChiA2 n=1 Tax=Talaromyces proteolyticus TaxID=1131652 RepID=A0AAD4PWW7_9EURO|nr:class III chitinase ChiA2 [Talaromyces proteolyticus]KAH8698637.1 class III chitinase ChiA2 [Talaromyces proteolyticus]
MHYSTLAGLGLMATTALAYPTIPRHSFRRDNSTSGAETVVYWGQNGGNAVENNDLSTYCTADSGIDILVLSFLYEFGNGVDTPSGTIGQSCSIDTSGKGSNCDDLAAAIKTCQGNGKKIILSLGGASGSYSLSSQQEAETIGQNLWDSYGNSGSSSAPRPFGSTFVNGFDFDLEANPAGTNTNYQYLIAKLRSNFASDSANTYYITGAPQCPIPEPNMQDVITTSQFDYLFVQFYNNQGCSTNTGTNYADWVKNVQNTPSANAKIVIGVPASELASNGAQTGAVYYLAPSDLSTLVGKYKSDSAFGGVMMWDAGFSDDNTNSGCTYAQEVHSILTTGSPCS